MSVGLIAAVAALVVGLFLIVLYNRLVRGRNGCDNAFSTIDVQLKMRCDLIPKVVDAVRGYMQHERGTLEQLTSLRNQATAPGVPAEKRMALDGQMSGLLQGLIARVEAYPDLKASDNFLALQRDLVGVEDHLQYARRFYNGAFRDLNDAVQRVPDLAVARAFAFGPGELYQAESEQRAAVSVRIP